jgi:catechol 2,3-dioxygenase-like lactoylglutathione lyase family enzyme
MRPPVISRIGHAALRVRDLDAALWTATEVMGLREVERDNGWVYLTHGAPHHSLQLRADDVDAVDHLGLEAAGAEALAEIRSRLSAAALPIISEGALDRGVRDGLAFEGPEGYIFDVYTSMSEDQPPYIPRGVRPRRFGHFNIYLTEPQPMIEMLQQVLDFRVSDYVGPGAFLRCNVDHHGIGIGKAEPTRIHHCAWEVESIADLARLGDILDDHKRHLLWGPVRHGVGENIAAYFVDASDLIVEYYSNMLRIYDDADFTPGQWERDDPRFYSVWARNNPDGFREHGLPVIKADGR